VPAIPVVVAEVSRREVPIELRAVGTVEAATTVTLASQVSGSLVEAPFREGDEVRAGQLLFRIDPRPFEAALARARANLARDRATAERAKLDLERKSALFQEGVISKEEYDRARTEAAAASALVAADEAAVEAARLDLEHCRILSPITGRIGRLLVHPGNLVRANETPLAVVHQTRPAYVRFSLPEAELPRIRETLRGSPPEVFAVPSGASRPVSGRVTFVDNAVDPATATVTLKAQFDNTDETLWPGQFANVTLRIDTIRDAVVVPRQAIVPGQGGQFAYVVRPDLTVEWRPIATGVSAGDLTVVEKGLAAGERVVTNGQLRLAPGLRVEPRESPEASGRRPEAGP
jgi:multidrug efflux system membrane fusion protein